jgi:hypothetical protein
VRQSRSPTSRGGYPCRNGEIVLDQRGRKTRRRTTDSFIRNRRARSCPRLRRVLSVSPPLQPLAGSGNALLLLIGGRPLARHPAPIAQPSNNGNACQAPRRYCRYSISVRSNLHIATTKATPHQLPIACRSWSTSLGGMGTMLSGPLACAALTPAAYREPYNGHRSRRH